MHFEDIFDSIVLGIVSKQIAVTAEFLSFLKLRGLKPASKKQYSKTNSYWSNHNVWPWFCQVPLPFEITGSGVLPVILSETWVSKAWVLKPWLINQ